MPDDNFDWMNLEALPSDSSSFDIMPMPTAPSNSSHSNYDNYPDAFCHNPTALSSPDSHTDLAKITEHETSNFPPSAEMKEGDETTLDLSYPSPLSVFQEHSSTSPSSKSPPTHHSSRRHSSAEYDSSKSGGRSQPPSPPDDVPKLKRRQSSSGRPVSCQTSNLIEDNVPLKKEASKELKAKLSTKSSHSATERKYRDNLNSKITELDHTLTLARQDSKRNGSVLDEKPSDAALGKTRKADVLNEAMRYVKHGEVESKARVDEIEFLRGRVAALEKLVGCGDCSLLKHFAESQISFPTHY